MALSQTILENSRKPHLSCIYKSLAVVNAKNTLKSTARQLKRRASNSAAHVQSQRASHYLALGNVAHLVLSWLLLCFPRCDKPSPQPLDKPGKAFK
jgi:hypothetical protein